MTVPRRLAAERGAPANIRADNSPEPTAVVLREWCRLGKTGIAYIDPGSRRQNPYVEPFNARLPDEMLNVKFTASWQRNSNTNVPVNPGLSLGVER